MNSQLTYMKKPELLKELELHRSHFFAVIDEKVKPQLPDWIISSENVFWIVDPEGSKSMEAYERVVSFFLERGISRASLLIAIGGGATTDLSGFVAATILRGIDWISIPTTLLAMVDGSIGGKVGLNMPQGKNLIGAFHHPEQIFICYDFLTTLPVREWQSGKGEILKYGFLSSEIHQAIVQKDSLETISHLCSEFKKNIVKSDFKEQGERVLLNLGHTLGHAFELSLGIPHGLAVMMGLKYLFLILDQKDQLKNWEELVSALELSQETTSLSSYPQFSMDKFINYLKQDKKKSHESIRLIVVKAVGNCIVNEMSLNEFISKIRYHAEFKR
jgi:3-dehydroquinate synthase